MDFSSHRKALFEHYVALLREPGWESYARARIAELAAESSGLYADFSKRLKRLEAAAKPKEKRDGV